MKELLEIFNAQNLTNETKISVLQKMVNVLDFQVGANVYGEIVAELCNILKNK